MNKIGFPFVLLSLCLAMTSCGDRKAPGSFLPSAQEFVYSSLAFSPISATQVGYHQHGSVRLDEMLDDYSPASLDKQRQFYRDFRTRMGRMDRQRMDPKDRADFDIVAGQISLALLELDTIQNYRHNPTLYVESIGNAMFGPHVLEYAPKEQRIRHIIARLKKVPAFLEQAKGNLVDAPEIWTTVALGENEGNIGLIDGEIRPTVPAELRSEYDQAAAPALGALREFNGWLKGSLSAKQRDWRLGSEKYGQKFQYVLGTDLNPEQVLQAAEEGVKRVHGQMFELALPLHEKWLPKHGKHADQKPVITEVLDKIAERHSTPETYMADAKRDLDEARAFVKEKGLVPLPPRDNLQVIPTPEFMRGIYAVGGFQSAPALEPELGAFYWLTPIPKDWPKERIESKLREYNFYKLKLLTIHEAIPGHYVQLEYANDVQPKPRRIVRSVFGNAPYIEGWAQYATQIVLDAGYMNNSPELRLTFLKEELRVLANTIIDIRLQTNRMTDQQALDLMMNETFQEKEEATAKLRRAKLSSAQLPTYFVGWRDWLRVREQDRRVKGNEFRLAEFNERALKQGAVPLPVLARLLTGKALGE